jgi:NADH-quinone oxidoreductase subunit E
MTRLPFKLKTEKKLPEKILNLLTAKTREQIDQWRAKFPPEHPESAIVPALWVAQHQNQGWLSPDLLDSVAIYLSVSPIRVYEVATFYSMFELKPVGQNKLEFCTNIPCLLRGCEKIVKYCEQYLNLKLGETSTDQKWTLRSVECLGHCDGAPMMLHNDKIITNLTVDKLDFILKNN